VSRHVLELAASPVPIEPLVAPAGDEQVVSPVAVVIPHRRTHRVLRAGGVRPSGRIGERAVAVVAIIAAGRVFRAVVRIDRTAVAEEDVEPAVAVTVDQRDTAAHHLGKVVASPPTGVESERDAGVRRDLAKGDRGGCLGFPEQGQAHDH
jgi:hypothetical protein